MKISKKIFNVLMIILLMLLFLEMIFWVFIKIEGKSIIINSLMPPTIIAVFFLFQAKNAKKRNNNMFFIDRMKYYFQFKGDLEKYYKFCITILLLSVFWIFLGIFQLIVEVL